MWILQNYQSTAKPSSNHTLKYKLQLQKSHTNKMGKYFFKHDNLARFSKMQTLIILENSSCERCIFSTSTPFHFLLSVNHQIFIFTLAKYLSSFTSFIKVHNHKFCPNFLSLSVPMFPFSLIPLWSTTIQIGLLPNLH